MQGRVDAAYDAFTATIARNRGVDVGDVRGGFGQGRMVGAAAAVRQGMADRVGTLEDTLQRFGVSQFGPPPAKAAASGRRAFAIEREKRAIALD